MFTLMTRFKLKIIDFKTEKVDENVQMKLEMIALTIRIKKIYLLNKIQTIHKELSKRVLIFGKVRPSESKCNFNYKVIF